MDNIFGSWYENLELTQKNGKFSVLRDDMANLTLFCAYLYVLLISQTVSTYSDSTIYFVEFFVVVLFLAEFAQRKIIIYTRCWTTIWREYVQVYVCVCVCVYFLKCIWNSKVRSEYKQYKLQLYARVHAHQHNATEIDALFEC